MILAELQGIPHVLLAEQLGVKVNAVYKLSHDARKALKSALEQAGFDENAVQEILRSQSWENP